MPVLTGSSSSSGLCTIGHEGAVLSVDAFDMRHQPDVEELEELRVGGEAVGFEFLPLVREAAEEVAMNFLVLLGTRIFDRIQIELFAF